MQMTYTTASGDTFDLIVHRIYGNCRRVKALMQANSQYLDILLFPAGVVLTVPETEEGQTDTDGLPPWRRNLEGSDR